MIIGYLLIQSFLFALSVWGYMSVARFLQTYPSIGDDSALEAFKKLARQNMYGALAYIGLSIPSVLLGIYLLLSIGMIGVAWVLGTSIVLLLVAQKAKGLETAVRNLPCANEDLMTKHREISQTWINKAFPDF